MSTSEEIIEFLRDTPADPSIAGLSSHTTYVLRKKV